MQSTNPITGSMMGLKKVLVDKPDCFNMRIDPAPKGWKFNYYYESYMQVGETIEDSMKRQCYRVVATHEDGRRRDATSKRSFDQAYHQVLLMIGDE